MKIDYVLVLKPPAPLTFSAIVDVPTNSSVTTDQILDFTDISNSSYIAAI